MKRTRGPSAVLLLVLFLIQVFLGAAIMPATHATTPFFFSTGSADGKIGTTSRPPSAGVLETETADDFLLSFPTTIDHATFVGLLPSGAPLSSVGQIVIQMYHIFPIDSADPPSGNVPTRVNSPSDVEFVVRDSEVSGDLTFTSTVLSSSFSVLNTVVNGINKFPNQFTGGEGPADGEEVLFDVTLTNPLVLAAGHYFFVPQVELSSGNFLWLSAPKPIVAPGTPFVADLQTWIRNSDLAPDWLRVGTDITHQGPFNAVFSLSGQTSVSGVPEFPGPLLLASAVGILAIATARRLVSR